MNNTPNMVDDNLGDALDSTFASSEDWFVTNETSGGVAIINDVPLPRRRRSIGAPPLYGGGNVAYQSASR